MRKAVLITVISLLALAGAVAGQIELSPEFMQGIEDTTRSLDANVTLKDAKAASSEAQELAKAFAEVEAYYSQRPDAAKGVQLAQQSRAHAEAVSRAIASNDFAAASDAVSSLARSCKSCHEVFKN